MKRPLRCLGPIFLALFVAVTVQSLAPTLANAQQQEEDVVYLKDGSVLRGTIIEDVPGAKDERILTRSASEQFVVVIWKTTCALRIGSCGPVLRL